MAIDAGVKIEAADLNRRGGVKFIYLCPLVDVATLTFSATAHELVDFTLDSGKTMFVYEFEKESASMAIATTKENGSTVAEVTINAYLPKCTPAKFHELNNMSTDVILAIVEDFNGNQWVVGADNVFTQQLDRGGSYAELTAMEGGTGAGFQDQNGVSFTIMARMGELPRAIPSSGVTITPDYAAGTVAIS